MAKRKITSSRPLDVTGKKAPRVKTSLKRRRRVSAKPMILLPSGEDPVQAGDPKVESEWADERKLKDDGEAYLILDERCKICGSHIYPLQPELHEVYERKQVCPVCLLKELDEALDEASGEKSTVDELEGDLTSITTKLSELEEAASERDGFEQEVAELWTKIEQLEVDASESSKDVEALEEQISELEGERAGFRQAVKEQDSVIVDLESKLADAKDAALVWLSEANSLREKAEKSHRKQSRKN